MSHPWGSSPLALPTYIIRIMHECFSTISHLMYKFINLKTLTKWMHVSMSQKRIFGYYISLCWLLLYNYPTPKITSPFYESSNKQLQEEKENWPPLLNMEGNLKELLVKRNVKSICRCHGDNFLWSKNSKEMTVCFLDLPDFMCKFIDQQCVFYFTA